MHTVAKTFLTGSLKNWVAFGAWGTISSTNCKQRGMNVGESKASSEALKGKLYDQVI